MIHVIVDLRTRASSMVCLTIAIAKLISTSSHSHRWRIVRADGWRRIPMIWVR